MPDTTYQYLVTIRNGSDENQRLVALTKAEEEQAVSALDELEESSRITSYDFADVPPTEESLAHLLNWASDCADAPAIEDDGEGK